MRRFNTENISFRKVNDFIFNMFPSKLIDTHNLKIILKRLKLSIIIEEYSQNKAKKRKRTDECEEESIIWNYENKKPRYEQG